MMKKKALIIVLLICLVSTFFISSVRAATLFYSGFETTGFPEFQSTNDAQQTTTRVLNGTYSVTETGGASSSFLMTANYSETSHIYAAVYVYWDNLDINQTYRCRIINCIVGDGNEVIDGGLWYNATSSQAQFYIESGEIGSIENSSVTLSSNQWIHVQIECEISATASMDLIIDGNVEATLTGDNNETDGFDLVQIRARDYGDPSDDPYIYDGIYFDDLRVDTSQIAYVPYYEVSVSSNPELNAGFNINGSAQTTPYSAMVLAANYEFACTDFEISINSSYKYTFDHWSINGSGSYGSMTINVDIAGDTNLTIHYLGSWIESPYYPTFAYNAINGTWYFRSDTHTIHDQLSYKLDPTNTATATNDTRTVSGNYSVTYGVRVWAIDLFGNLYELSGGTPEAQVTRTTDGEGILSAYFDCPAYNSLIDAIQVNVYQRFGSDSWSLRRYFRTQTSLYIKLPASSWTIYYFINRTTSTTDSYFFHGSSAFPSRIDLQYYRANPWDLALARLGALDFFGFLFTPWTYWLGDIFWAFMLFFGVVTGYGRTRSFKPLLALLWILGGAGSVLSLMLPMIVLRLAWLMLAVAMGVTIFKLVWR